MPGEEVIYRKFEAAYKIVKEDLDKIVVIFLEGSKTGKVEYNRILASVQVVQKIGGDVRKYGNELMQYHADSAEKTIKSAEEISSKGMKLIILILVAGSIASVLYAFYFVRSLVGLLTGVSKKLTDSGVRVSSGAVEISSTAQELSQATTEQAASLQETAASIEEMASTIQKSAENARLTNEYASNSKASALDGQKIVGEMINAVGEIDYSNKNISMAVDESNKKMVEIAKVIEDIGTKTKVINDIVFQTKLLSFNASVEAARAGKQGKGFAVVAEEVGSLAEMSGKAAKEISDMLNSSITHVEEMVKTTKITVDQLMSVSKSKVEAGTIVAKKCEDILSSIVAAVDDVNRLSSEISIGAEEQSKGIQEISKATGMLESVTQPNSTASHQAANAAEDLSHQANQLNQVVQELNMVIHGS